MVKITQFCELDQLIHSKRSVTIQMIQFTKLVLFCELDQLSNSKRSLMILEQIRRWFFL